MIGCACRRSQRSLRLRAGRSRFKSSHGKRVTQMAARVPGFAHLHNHTTYSLLDGAQRIDEMCARAAEDGQESLAITDHGNLFGVMAFGKSAAKHGLKPIIGIEAYVAPGEMRDKQPQVVPNVGKKTPVGHLWCATAIYCINFKRTYGEQVKFLGHFC